MSRNPAGKDQRRHIRRVVGIRGTVILPDGQSLPCEISDISETGAMLRLSMQLDLPIEFLLEISGINAVRRRCQRTRQDGMTAGVRFPDRPLNRP